MGSNAGSIIATIITVHMPRNDIVVASQVWPGMGIHAIDKDQPPGIGIRCMADMDSHQRMVSVALTANRAAEVQKNARSEAIRCDIACSSVVSRRAACSTAAVFIVTAPPYAALVAPFGRAVEPLIHGPESMAYNGAGGATEREMRRALGFEQLGLMNPQPETK
jgi:hypothetical protein